MTHPHHGHHARSDYGRLIAAILMLCLLAAAGYALQHTISCFLLSWIIAYLLDPLVLKLEERGLTRPWALAVMLAPGAAAAQSKQLLLYSWANYVPADLLKRFEAETGIKVSVDVYDSNDTMLAKLQACRAALDGGVAEVVIADGRDPARLAALLQAGAAANGASTRVL